MSEDEEYEEKKPGDVIGRIGKMKIRKGIPIPNAGDYDIHFFLDKDENEDEEEE